jgi:hypothetical protein
VLIKDPHGPDPIPVMVSVLPKDRPSVPGNPARRNPDGADGLPYIQPGPWKSKLTSWFDTWRFVNGKADEHWDPATIAPPAPAPAGR